MRLAGKRAIVTGGGSGIGKAIALLFAQQGCEVLITARRPAPLEATSVLSERIYGFSADLTSPDGPNQIVTEAVKALGGVDILVNNSGLFQAPGIDKSSEDLYDKLFAVNVKGLYRMTQAALPELRKGTGANILNIGSIVGLIGIRNTSLYSATKGAVIQITRSLAAELAAEKIRVNCVCPGLVRNELTEELTSNPDFVKHALPAYPIGRFGEPEDVAYACLYLASEEASWLTGVILPVDGGYTTL
jgi:NAD(P)-dependent dehydrogenase (short-subunit alcohol dehydrogenase family)